MGSLGGGARVPGEVDQEEGRQVMEAGEGQSGGASQSPLLGRQKP
jgi:hypothetical protein